jgi:hypothetical protein
MYWNQIDPPGRSGTYEWLHGAFPTTQVPLFCLSFLILFFISSGHFLDYFEGPMEVNSFSGNQKRLHRYEKIQNPCVIMT